MKRLPQLLLGSLYGIGLVFLILLLLSLPLTTSVSVGVWSGLLLSVAGCFFGALRMKPRTHGAILLLVGVLVIDGVAGFLSHVTATTPSITDTSGKPVPGSIAVLEQVDVNGSKQWITIRGKDKTKPILLYLGIGGPGAGGFPATAMNLKPLEDHFVVVNWDQPGTGKSYHAVPIASLTPQRFVEDARVLTDMMRERFHQPKIYVMGLSWGTIVGTKLVSQYPDRFYAYLGNGQMVNTVENDRLGYDLAVTFAQEQGDKRTTAQLKQYGPPPYTGRGLAMKYAGYNNVLFKYMGSPTIPMILVVAPQFAPEYGWLDKINFGRGLIESFTTLYPQLENLDFISQIPQVNVPMYFLVGRRDINAVASIVERYYNALKAPYKELIWLDSAHGADAEEIMDALVNHILITSPPLP